jgi:hypothetical protein
VFRTLVGWMHDYNTTHSPSSLGYRTHEEFLGPYEISALPQESLASGWTDPNSNTKFVVEITTDDPTSRLVLSGLHHEHVSCIRRPVCLKVPEQVRAGGRGRECL